MLRLEHPFALVALALLPWVWWIAATRRTHVERVRIAWRAMTLLALVLAMGGLAVATGEAPVTVMVALDRSASVSLGTERLALARVNALAETMKPGDRLGLVVFGAEAAVERRPARVISSLDVLQTAVTDAGTDISAALRVARAALAANAGGRILLVSDGRETKGDGLREARRSKEAGVPVDVLSLPSDGVEPLRVVRVEAPLEANVGEPFIVSVEVAGAAGARGQVTLFRDEQAIDTRPVAIGAGGSAAVAVTERQTEPRAVVYRAVLNGDDAATGARSRGAVVVVAGEPTILYVTTSSATLAPVLTNAGFRLRQVEPRQVPDTRQAFAAFAGVVLDDVPTEQLSNGSLEALAEYAEDSGGGLLILGSPRTLTLGGYPATALERVMPIDLRPRSGRRGSTLDLVLVFDKSGSMADLADGVPTIEVARQAVMRVMNVLPPSDRIGVIAFAETPETVAALAPGHDLAAMRSALQAVAPNGSTAIAPALEMAIEWLRAPGRSAAERRQVLLMSDGRTSAADAARVREIARERAAEISVVALGSGANRPLLESLASESGGRAYFPETLSDLPRAVAREAARSSGGGTVEERFVPRALVHPSLAGIDRTTLPSLGGYVVSVTKPTASSILTSHLDDPILATWNAGLGRVAVFTADLASPLSAQLRSWRDGGRMWTQVVRWLSRREQDADLQASIQDTRTGPRIEVVADRLDGTFLDLADVSAVVRTPLGDEEQVVLEPVMPGRYEAPMPTSAEGPYVVAVTARERATGTEHRLVRALYWSADRESEGIGQDTQFLSRLTEAAGGGVVGERESPFDGPRPAGYRDVSAWAAGAGLVMFVLDIGTDLGRRARRRWRPRRPVAGTPAQAASPGV